MIRSAILRSQFDCSRRVVTILGVVRYTARGRFRSSEQRSGARAEPFRAFPSSAEAAIMTHYCQAMADRRER